MYVKNIGPPLIRIIRVGVIWILLNLPGYASTIGMIGGDATIDGRPLLVKNRDNSANANQEFYYNDSGPYHYISVSYAGVEDQAWGGANELGFYINNADAWNFDDEVPGPDDDGIIMDLALRTCQTVDDFQTIMDSTDIAGRTLPTMYGVMDATGSGAIFEAASYEHYRFNLGDTTAAPNGYMVRANFAYEGGAYHLGQHRHDRFLALVDSAYAGNFISHLFITQTIQMDIVNEEIDPYPLPYEGHDGQLPYGLIHSHDAINRDITRSGFTIQGIRQGEDPLLTTIWALVGEPICTVALPLWIHAGSTPVEFDGTEFSAINLKAQAFRDYLYETNWDDDALDTWKMVDERGEGLIPYINALEIQMATRGDSALNVWRNQGLPSSTEVENFQDVIASESLTTLESWGPPQSPIITLTWLSIDQVQLDWFPITLDVFDRTISISAYTIYGSDFPFYNREAGDSITAVSISPVTISTPETYRFFQVRCQP
jgi:hypothetical protein